MVELYDHQRSVASKPLAVRMMRHADAIAEHCKAPLTWHCGPFKVANDVAHCEATSSDCTVEDATLHQNNCF
eukprot:5274357-Amphidinium_carterae.1